MASPPPPKNGSKPSPEYDRFEALTKALVKVPKDELDKARKRDEKKRAKRK